jgi:phage terminase small subunit
MTQDAKPTPPEHLSARSRRLWTTTLDTYDLEPTEVETLRMALEARDRAEQARKVLRREGVTFVDRFGTPRLHPATTLERDSRQAWIRLTAALGLPLEDDDAPKLDRRTATGRARAFRQEDAA